MALTLGTPDVVKKTEFAAILYNFLSSRPSEHIRGAIGISGILALCSVTMTHVSSQETLSRAPEPDQARMGALPPVPPPLLLRDVVPRDAVNINRNIPLSPGPTMAALPFKVAGDRETARRAVECLATAIYYEAGAEPLDGQRAVAQVILNRVRHPAFLPSVCGVVYQGSTRTTGCQFSFTCDGSQRVKPMPSAWVRAHAIATAALTGSVFKPVGYATHFHADYVVPYWATSLTKRKVIGRHIFYGWPSYWGAALAFTRRHTGTEPDPQLLRATAFASRPSRQGSDIVPTAQPAQAAQDVDLRGAFIGVVQLLAARPSAASQPSPAGSDAYRHFSGYSDHAAIQIYRQLAAADSQFESKTFPEILKQHSEPPELASLREPSRELIAAIGGGPKLLGFVSSLRDFARHSDFAAFAQKRQSPDTACRSGSTRNATCSFQPKGARASR